jgi:hypothetical protein
LLLKKYSKMNRNKRSILSLLPMQQPNSKTKGVSSVEEETPF